MERPRRPILGSELPLDTKRRPLDFKRRSLKKKRQPVETKRRRLTLKRRPFEPVTLSVDSLARPLDRKTKRGPLKTKPAKPPTKSVNSAGLSLDVMQSLVELAALPLERKARPLDASVLLVHRVRRPRDRVRRSRVLPTLPRLRGSYPLGHSCPRRIRTHETHEPAADRRHVACKTARHRRCSPILALAAASGERGHHHGLRVSIMTPVRR